MTYFKVNVFNTPFHKASEDCDLPKCKLIIDHVEDKNPASANLSKDTPLHKASANDHLDCFSSKFPYNHSDMKE